MSETESIRPEQPFSTKFNELATLLVPLVASGFGVGMMWPWLESEHARLTWWEIPLSWSSEMIGVIWYLSYARSYLYAPSIQAASISDPSIPLPSNWRFFAATFAIAVSADIGVAILTRHHEVAGRQRAVPVNGEVIRGRCHHKTADGGKYILHCRFTDATGSVHTVRMSVVTPLADLLPRLELAIQNQAFPRPVDMLYDPDHPPRCWLKIERGTGDRIYHLSLLVVLVQLILSPVFYHLHRQRMSPPPEAAPFIAASFSLGFLGLMSVSVAPF